MSSPYTKASEIAAEITTRLADILQVNGTETDIGQRVYRGRRNVDESLVPCVVLIEGNDSVTGRPGRLPAASIVQRYVIAAYLPCDPDNPNDAAHAAVRDIKRAIFRCDTTFGQRVRRVDYLGKDIGPRADSRPIVFVTLDIEVEYVEDLTNP